MTRSILNAPRRSRQVPSVGFSLSALRMNRQPSARWRERPGLHESGIAPAGAAQQAALQARANAITNQEVAFIDNPSFWETGAEKNILHEFETVTSAQRRGAKPPDGIPAYFAALYSTPLLTAAEEVDLFRRMNFLKYLTNASRSKVDPQKPDLNWIEEIEAFLRQVNDIRNRLVEANLRLVVSIARRLTNHHYPFDDVVSDGNLALLRAVEKFDYARGFRFSTYATHVIQRELYRQAQHRCDEGQRTASGVDEWVAATPDNHGSDDRPAEVFDQWQRLLSLMEGELDDREQFVLAMRIGLDLDLGPQTLQSIGSRLGISKERVRQLEVRAIERLQSVAQGFIAKDAS